MMMSKVLRRVLLTASTLACVCTYASGPLHAETLPLVTNVESQPLKSQAKRVAAALEYLGHPLTAAESKELAAALDNTSDMDAIAGIQNVLDRRALIGVNINPESRVKTLRGTAPAILTEQGWSVFLVKVHNEAGVTSKLACSSPNSAPLQQRSRGAAEPKPTVTPKDVPNRWLELTFPLTQPSPLGRGLHGVGRFRSVLGDVTGDDLGAVNSVTYLRPVETVTAGPPVFSEKHRPIPMHTGFSAS